MFVQSLIFPQDAEVPVGSSITEVTESLDIQRMLNRAAQGIIDLQAYQEPMSYDSDDPDKLSLDESDHSDNIFGMSREQAVNELDRANETLAQELAKGKMKTEDQPGEAAPGAEPSEE